MHNSVILRNTEDYGNNLQALLLVPLLLGTIYFDWQRVLIFWVLTFNSGVLTTMNKKLLSKKLVVLFLAGIITVMAVSYLPSSQAQVQPKTQQTALPKFTSFKEAGELELQGNGKPFIPSGLRQAAKPNSGKIRGIPDGIDDRIPMTSKEYPWSAIGRVEGTTADAKNYHCTGTLIYDNLVLTNAHCVIDNNTGLPSRELQFLPNVINGRVQNNRDVALVEQVVYGTDFKNGQQDAVNDWAVLKINKVLGRKYGYLGWVSLPSSTLARNRKSSFFVGYSGDFPSSEYQKYFTAGPGWTAGFEQGCGIVGEEANFLLHDCDTAGGSSGGPIIGMINGEPYIVALNNIELKDLRSKRDIINAAVKVDFLDRLFGRN